MKEEELIKKIIAHIEEISGGLEKTNQASILKADFEKNIASIEKFIGSKISSVLVNVWSKFNSQIFKNEVGIKASEKLPALEKGELIEFARFFSIEATGDFVLEMIKSNNDIFERKYIPFAEALEGDFFALNNESNAIHYIMHDFNDDEKYSYKVAENIESFFLSLQLIESISNDNNKKEPKIVSSSLSNSLLSKLQDFKKNNP